MKLTNSRRVHAWLGPTKLDQLPHLGYPRYWSDSHHLQGVAIAISSRVQPSVVEVTPVDERIMALRLKLKFSSMSLIAITLLLMCRTVVHGEIFQRSDPHRWTWYRDAGNAAKEIDHILVSTRKILQNCRVYRSTEFCDADRRLVVATLRVHFKTPQRDKVQFIRSLAKEVECHFLVNDFRPVYHTPRKLNSKPSSQVNAVRSVSSQIISGPVAVPERWDECFEQLYQVDRPAVNLYAGSVEIPLPDPPISEDPPSLTEVRGAISKLKSEAAGICGIPAELLKIGGEPMARRVHAVLSAIWQSSTIPSDLLRDVVIPLWKGKGDQWDCNNHRGITLFSIPSKVLRRIRDHLLRYQRLE
ncbi:uncharacterized protein [Penaeus vannamei]|uniref:uncharacterized protein n=1 Tax=Penaeus vannamei TaxID=6689 RepID=UPI00387FADA3